ncbi:hypothetical protein BDP55DRAFT_619425 [Colletotrichum godetiae]|uniref:N-acetyltransferase domain-containing protein n=1 Tax=Colletotrichum godetiae TaxID=1209918 RepID=A0AAJ0AB20_9PEZI|nr:uncharacterized protein BDP55DRAFT_619425 [Colletotrichum godetiae]KAK1659832.1 hypothetical protein BDP55DRAFT_619425 [Colletotrichum godetiae]
MAPKSSPSLRFSDFPDVKIFEADEPRRKRRKASTETMAKLVSNFNGQQVTDDMLKDAAKLFSENYGFWGNEGRGSPGSRVKMSADRLRGQCLPEGSNNTYVSIHIDGVLAGNAFACRWEHANRRVCWITQLVVHSHYREQNLATTLLLNLIDDDDDVLGIMSSHPAACKALAKAIGDIRFSDVSMDYARDHAADVLKASPITYVREAQLCGRLFHSDDASGMVSGVNSNFYVDHAEPLDALACFQEDGNWPLGELPDGHEFLFLVEKSRRRRSRSASARRRYAATGENEASLATS